MPLRLLQFNLNKFLKVSNLFVPFYLVCCNAFCILDFIYCLYICYFVSSLCLLGILFHCFIHLRFCFIALFACSFFIFYFVLSLYSCTICFTVLFTCDFISSIYSHLWLVGHDLSLFGNRCRILSRQGSCLDKGWVLLFALNFETGLVSKYLGIYHLLYIVASYQYGVCQQWFSVP